MCLTCYDGYEVNDLMQCETISSSGLDWWAIMLIVVAGIIVLGALGKIRYT